MQRIHGRLDAGETHPDKCIEQVMPVIGFSHDLAGRVNPELVSFVIQFGAWDKTDPVPALRNQAVGQEGIQLLTAWELLTFKLLK